MKFTPKVGCIEKYGKTAASKLLSIMYSVSRAHKCKIDLTAWIKARKVCFDIKEICLAEIWSKSLIKSRSPGNDWYEEVQYTALELAPVVRWPAWISKSFALTDMQLYLYRGPQEWIQDSEIIRQRNEKIAILQKSEKQNGYHYKTANTTKGRFFWQWWIDKWIHSFK